MIALRRYEILLPSKFNDGGAIPEERIAETLQELEQEFEVVSCETQIEGKASGYALARVFVDVSDTPAKRQFFVDYKDKLKRRFQQLDIWLTTHPVEIV